MDRQMDKDSYRDAKMNLKMIFNHIPNQTLYQQITGLSISIVVNFVKLRQGNYCDDKQEDFYIKIAKHGLQLQVMTQVAFKQNLDHTQWPPDNARFDYDDTSPIHHLVMKSVKQ